MKSIEHETSVSQQSSTSIVEGSAIAKRQSESSNDHRNLIEAGGGGPSKDLKQILCKNSTLQNGDLLLHLVNGTSASNRTAEPADNVAVEKAPKGTRNDF